MSPVGGSVTGVRVEPPPTVHALEAAMPRKTTHTHALPAEAVRERAAHRRSGAAGVHADQRTRVLRTGSTNRVGSRSAQTRAAVRNGGW